MILFQFCIMAVTAVAVIAVMYIIDTDLRRPGSGLIPRLMQAARNASTVVSAGNVRMISLFVARSSPLDPALSACQVLPSWSAVFRTATVTVSSFLR